MHIVMFYHSLLSDWNHGNAHFLRGVVTELQRRGHSVTVYEPRFGWSYENLIAQAGEAKVRELYDYYPTLAAVPYELDALNLDAALDGADLVLVHEWNKPELVARIGRHHRAGGDYALLFHDTHHRSVTNPKAMSTCDLSGYDGVLAFGGIVRRIYLRNGWTRRAWVWHEAADTRLFRPPPPGARAEGDLVWIGNWGDEERTAELHEFLIEPVKSLGLRARIHGVRYPKQARRALARAGIEYAGWLPNYKVPETFARFRLTVHVPRRPYVEALPGIPTIRPFEALACGIPLVCSPWDDAEHLFMRGRDYIVARDGEEMKRCLRELLDDAKRAAALADHGRRTILRRHTCAHRVDELMAICRQMQIGGDEAAPAHRHVNTC